MRRKKSNGRGCQMSLLFFQLDMFRFLTGRHALSVVMVSWRVGDHVSIVRPTIFFCCCHDTMGQNNQESKSKYRAICLCIRSFAHTAHLFACFTLLASHCSHYSRACFACAQSFAHSFSHSLVPELMEKRFLSIK